MENYQYWNSWDQFLDKLPDFILALVVLLIGWIVAKAIEKAVLKGLKKTNLDDRLFGGNHQSRKYNSEKIISKIIYYLLLVFVFILFFNILDLNIIAEPLVSMFSSITAAIPSILKAALILLVAWLVATALKIVIKKGGRTLQVHEKLNKYNLVKDHQHKENLVDKVANIVFYLVLLISLPAVLAALNLKGVSEPFSGMLHNILTFLPKLFAAALIVLVGWFIARIVRDIVTKFLQSIGTEKLVDRFGLGNLFKGTTLSSVIGTVVFVLILIPTVISALERLDINGISEPAIGMLNTMLDMLPNIFVAILMVIIGVWLGKWVKQLVVTLLERIGFDSIFKGMGFKRAATTASSLSLSQVVGYVVQVFIVLLFVVEALNIIKLDFLVKLATGVIAYLPNVVAAIVIIAVGMMLGNLVKGLLSGVLGGTNLSVLSSIAKYAILAISIFMALDQLGVAASIVNSAFILILGGLALAFGLAFGLGGKDFAAKYLQKLDQKMEQTKVSRAANKQMDNRPTQPKNMNKINPNPPNHLNNNNDPLNP